MISEVSPFPFENPLAEQYIHRRFAKAYCSKYSAILKPGRECRALSSELHQRMVEALLKVKIGLSSADSDISVAHLNKGISAFNLCFLDILKFYYFGKTEKPSEGEGQEKVIAKFQDLENIALTIESIIKTKVLQNKSIPPSFSTALKTTLYELHRSYIENDVDNEGEYFIYVFKSVVGFLNCFFQLLNEPLADKEEILMPIQTQQEWIKSRLASLEPFFLTEGIHLQDHLKCLSPHQIVHLTFVSALLKILKEAKKSIDPAVNILIEIAKRCLKKPWLNQPRLQRVTELSNLSEAYKNLAKRLESSSAFIEPIFTVLTEIEIEFSDAPLYHEPISTQKMSTKHIQETFRYISNSIMIQLIDLLPPLSRAISHQLNHQFGVIVKTAGTCLEKLFEDNPDQFKAKLARMRSKSGVDYAPGKIGQFYVSIKSKIPRIENFTKKQVKILKENCSSIPTLQSNPVDEIIKITKNWQLINKYQREQGLLLFSLNNDFEELANFLFKRLNNGFSLDAFQSYCDFYYFLHQNLTIFLKTIDTAEGNIECEINILVPLLCELLAAQIDLSVAESQEDVHRFKKRVIELQDQICKVHKLPSSIIEGLNRAFEKTRDSFFKVFHALAKKLRFRIHSRTQKPQPAKSPAQIFKNFSKVLTELASQEKSTLPDAKVTFTEIVQELQKLFNQSYLHSSTTKYSQMNANAEELYALDRQDEESEKAFSHFKSTLEKLSICTDMLCKSLSSTISSLMQTSAFTDWRTLIDLDDPLEETSARFYSDEQLQSKKKVEEKKAKLAKQSHNPEKRRSSPPPSPKSILRRVVKQIDQSLLAPSSPYSSSTQLIQLFQDHVVHSNKLKVGIFPLDRLGKLQTRHHLAYCDKKLSLDLLTRVMEMLSYRQVYQGPNSAPFAASLMSFGMLEGYLAIERTLSGRVVAKNPQKTLRHSLTFLINELDLTNFPKMRTSYLDHTTTEYRYPRDGLQGKALIAKRSEFLQEVATLLTRSEESLEEAEKLQTQMEPLFKQISLEFTKHDLHFPGPALTASEESRLQAISLRINKTMVDLQSFLDAQGKKSRDEILPVIMKHLETVRDVPHILGQFTHQRFLVIPAFMLFLAGQYASEGVGRWIAQQEGVQDPLLEFGKDIHKIKEIYCDIYNMHLPVADQEMLFGLNMDKALEYFHTHCSRSTEVTPPLIFLNELLKWSTAAVDAEGYWTAPYLDASMDPEMEVGRLRSELIQYCERVASVLDDLVRGHILEEA